MMMIYLKADKWDSKIQFKVLIGWSKRKRIQELERQIVKQTIHKLEETIQKFLKVKDLG